MKIWKIIAGIFLLALIVIQFIPNELPPNNKLLDNDLIANAGVDPEVGNLLQASCYDCHSSQVNYPWYSYVAPVSWLVRKDVLEGTEELNFSEWNNYSKRRMIKKLDEIKEEVADGKMPLKIYTAIHRNAVLDDDQVTMISDWVDQYSLSLLEE